MCCCEVIIISNSNFKPNKTRILLGKNITYFRQLPEFNYSQDQLASILKSDKCYISNLENGKRNTSVDYINRLAEIFNIQPSELLVEREFNLKTRIDSK